MNTGLKTAVSGSWPESTRLGAVRSPARLRLPRWVMPQEIPEAWFGLIRDSKQMSPAKRAFACEQIGRHARAVGVGSSTPFEIGSIGIVPATRLAMTRAIDDLGVAPDHLLIDAVFLPDVSVPQTPDHQGRYHFDQHCSRVDRRQSDAGSVDGRVV